MLLSLFVIHLCALAAPGPDFFFVSRTAMSGRPRHLVESAFGVSVGILIWAGLTLLGLNLLFEQFPYAKLLIMAGGALYLYKLALDIYRSARQQMTELTTLEQQPEHVFLKGLLTNLSNPKAVIYFTSIFSSIPGIGSHSAMMTQIMLLITIESLIWFLMIGKMFSLKKIRSSYQQHKTRVDYLSAAIFALFATLILVEVLHTVWS